MATMSTLIEVPEIGRSEAAELGLQSTEFISDGDQFLTFKLSEEHYAVNILSVTEIRGWETPTLLPNTPEYVRGVINLRGIIVPIMDLRIRFQIGQAEYTPTTVVVVLAINHGTRSSTVGFVVDAVSDVLNTDDKDIRPAPPFGGLVDNRFIQGLVNVGADVVTVLNVECLNAIDDEELNDD